MPERQTGLYNIGKSVYALGPRAKNLSTVSDLPSEETFTIWKQRPYIHELILGKWQIGLREGPKFFDALYIDHAEKMLNWIHELKEEDFIRRDNREPLFLNQDFKVSLVTLLRYMRNTNDKEALRERLIAFLNEAAIEMMLKEVLNSDFDPLSPGHAVIK